MAFQPDDALLFQGLAELIQETRLPDAWLTTNTHYLSTPGLGTCQAVVQEVELSLASHQGREPSLDTNLQAAAPPPAAGHLIHLDRLDSPFDLNRPLRCVMDVSFHQPLGGLPDENRPGSARLCRRAATLVVSPTAV